MVVCLPDSQLLPCQAALSMKHAALCLAPLRGSIKGASSVVPRPATPCLGIPQANADKGFKVNACGRGKLADLGLPQSGHVDFVWCYLTLR